MTNYSTELIININFINNFKLMFKGLSKQLSLFNKVTCYVSSKDQALLDEIDIYTLIHPNNVFQVIYKEDISINELLNSKKDEESIYVYIKDSIIFIEPKSINYLLDFCIQNPEYKLIIPEIINTNRTSYMHQVMGIISDSLIHGWSEKYLDTYNLNKIHNKFFRDEIIENFLTNLKKGNIDKFRFPNYVINKNEYLESDSFCWIGKNLIDFNIIVNDFIQQTNNQKCIIHCKCIMLKTHKLLNQELYNKLKNELY